MMCDEPKSMTHSSVGIGLVLPVAKESSVITNCKAELGVCIISFRQRSDDTLIRRNTLDKNIPRIPWTLESVINWKLDWLEITIEPISKCYHIILHAGTGNPELMIDYLTNQKGSKLPPTCDKHNSQEGKWYVNYYDRTTKVKWTKGKAPSLNSVILLWCIV